MQRSNHGSTQDALEELRERYARLKSSGDGHVDSTSRIDHLNDRLIARHQEVDHILAASVEKITRPQRQLLQLGVAQVRQLRPDSRARVLSLGASSFHSLKSRLSLSVSQDNILELRSWLARFRTPEYGDSASPYGACASHSCGSILPDTKYFT